ncbi:TadE/TadG family type IV pilus assembly protein [uncultured Tateyamaria sp.]|uniref:TadE/TadG family type IV pilus assembly protein n=1 Tax=uncultured Tateyamaria sp. TaxID=455651 RepID=UPI00261AADE3|nr:TadE/TadG family type IV pilus assembly protein [uncultured Tateyamaria sp.]
MIRFTNFLRRFRDDEKGMIAVETVIIIPVLFWAYLSMFAIFDAYRQHSLNQKAAYTLGDIISRETTPLDSAYLNGTREMLAYLTANRKWDVAIRVTSVRYDANNDIYKRDWSRRKGWQPALTNTAVKALKDNLPVLPHNERVMVVETFVKYDPPFNTGLQSREIHNFVFTRPRYAPRVLWDNGT